MKRFIRMLVALALVVALAVPMTNVQAETATGEQETIKEISVFAGKTLYEGQVEEAWQITDAFTIYKITTKEGTTVYPGDWCLEQLYNQSVFVQEPEDPNYEWCVGKHTVTVEFMGKTCETEVEIVENPIASIQVEGGLLYEGTQEMQYLFNELTEIDEECLVYEVADAIESITVTETDGTIRMFATWDKMEDYYGVPGVVIESDQSASNAWGLGEHEAILCYMGIESTFEIEVVENPVVVIAATIKDIHMKDGREMTKANGEKYLYYEVWNNIDNLTLTFEDGTTQTANVYEFTDKYNCWYTGTHDQRRNPWGLGEHEVDFSFMGLDCKATVNIVETIDNVVAIPDAERDNYLSSTTDDLIMDILNNNLSEGIVTDETAEAIEAAVYAGESIEETIFEVQELTEDEAVELTSEEEVQEMVSAVQEEWSETAALHYLDMEVALVVNDEQIGTIDELDESLDITITIPEGMMNEDGEYKIVRNHDGEITVLDAVDNGDGTLTFESDCFSVYALAYDDGQVSGNQPSGGQQGTIVPNDGNDDNKASTTPIQNGTAIQELSTSTNQKDITTEDKSPDTGDVSEFPVEIGFFLLAGVVLAIVYVRRRVVLK